MQEVLANEAIFIIGLSLIWPNIQFNKCEAGRYILLMIAYETKFSVSLACFQFVVHSATDFRI